MNEPDAKAMVHWLTEQIRINNVCIAHYKQFPEFDPDGKYAKGHQESNDWLSERLLWWSGKVE